ncbi:MAG: hypothetical protein K2H33_06150 [Muribaculaceae bacterium]|nr:hypothetical protein [Muribaculaceae bacterium]MDE6120017.1 hypothetical protein [Muribaculaceae bacterium]
MEPGMYEYSVSAYNSSCLKRNSEIDPTGGRESIKAIIIRYLTTISE